MKSQKTQKRNSLLRNVKICDDDDAYEAKCKIKKDNKNPA